MRRLRATWCSWGMVVVCAAAVLLMAAVGLALVLILTREAHTHTHTIKQTINLSIIVSINHPNAMPMVKMTGRRCVHLSYRVEGSDNRRRCRATQSPGPADYGRSTQQPTHNA